LISLISLNKSLLLSTSEDGKVTLPMRVPRYHNLRLSHVTTGARSWVKQWRVITSILPS